MSSIKIQELDFGIWINGKVLVAYNLTRNAELES